MKRSKKIALIVFVIGIGLFGYSQYASASQIGVIITESQLLKEDDNGSHYNLQLEFDNPSLLILTAGKTDFIVTANGVKIGEGTLQPFTIPSLSKAKASGTFFVDSEYQSDETPSVRISGVTKYNVLFTSIDVPFVYYPTEQQAREFIHQN